MICLVKEIQEQYSEVCFLCGALAKLDSIHYLDDGMMEASFYSGVFPAWNVHVALSYSKLIKSVHIMKN